MGHQVFAEDGPLGDNHGVWPFLRTYSICKIAAEGTARCGRRSASGCPPPSPGCRCPTATGAGGRPSTCEMMLNGHDIPVHVDAPSVYHPLHEDDIVAMVPAPARRGHGPATTVNWGGSQAVSIEEWCGYLAELTGHGRPASRPPRETIDSVRDRPDPDARAGRADDGAWRDGMRRMAKALHPDRVP